MIPTKEPLRRYRSKSWQAVFQTAFLFEDQLGHT